MYNKVDTFGIIKTDIHKKKCINSDNGQKTTQDNWNYLYFVVIV